MKQRRTWRVGLTIASAGVLAVAWVSSNARAAGEEMRGPEAFANIKNTRQRSVALFQEASKVLTHARCVNCHPDGDRPLQGDAMVEHQPWVQRGPDGLGAIGMRCSTCHPIGNYDPGQVPGAPLWHLAPRSMAWQNKTVGEICRQIKDPDRNGNRNLEQLVHHMAVDHLVGWAWSPGEGREPVPGDQKTFGAVLAAWVETGAACPE